MIGIWFNRSNIRQAFHIKILPCIAKRFDQGSLSTLTRSNYSHARELRQIFIEKRLKNSFHSMHIQTLTFDMQY